MNADEIQRFIDNYPVTYYGRVEFYSSRPFLYGFFYNKTEDELKAKNKWRFISNNLIQEYNAAKTESEKLKHTIIVEGNDIKSITASVQ